MEKALIIGILSACLLGSCQGASEPSRHPHPAAVTLVGFSQAHSSLREGDTAATPAGLAVVLSGPATTDSLVALESGDTGALTVDGDGVTIPAGQTSAPVVLTAVTQALSVTLTARWAGAEKQTSVRVLGATEAAAP